MPHATHADLIGTILSFRRKCLVSLFEGQRHGPHGREIGNLIHVSTPPVRFRFKTVASSFSLRRIWGCKKCRFFGKKSPQIPCPSTVFALRDQCSPKVASNSRRSWNFYRPCVRSDPSEVHGNEAGPPRVPSAAQNGDPTSEKPPGRGTSVSTRKRGRPSFPGRLTMP